MPSSLIILERELAPATQYVEPWKIANAVIINSIITVVVTIMITVLMMTIITIIMTVV